MSLHEAFPEPATLRRTARGLWLPTPVPVLLEAARVLFGPPGLLPGARRVVDAGAGDGRVLACFAAVAPHLGLFGLECDTDLVATARDHLRGLGPVVEVARGDFLDAAAYAALAAPLHTVDLVVHYPDGNERALEDLVGSLPRPRPRLALLGPDASLTFARRPPAVRERIHPGDGTPAWWLVVSEG